jgi:hypothetical protein
MTIRIANIELAQTVLAAAAANVAKALDAVGGSLQDKLALAVAAEHELTEATQAIEASLAAARAAAADRAVRIRAELREAAMTEVVAMLRDGSVTLADIAARAGVAIEGNMTFERVAVLPAAPVTPPVALAPVVAAPAPAPVQVPLVTANGAPLPADVRENLRLQAGYMHPVKFRDPTTGAGWSGRGPTPKWLKALCVDGKTVEDFRVTGAEPASAPAAQVAAETPAAEVVAAEVAAAPAVQVEPEAPVVEAADPAAAPADVTPAADASPTDADIGEEVGSFDASGLDGDLNAPVGSEGDDDIGEFVAGIAAMSLDAQAGNAAQFLAVA